MFVIVILKERLVCWLFGHKPDGPIDVNIDIGLFHYRCARCGEKISFDRDKGWLRVK